MRVKVMMNERILVKVRLLVMLACCISFVTSTLASPAMPGQIEEPVPKYSVLSNEVKDSKREVKILLRNDASFAEEKLKILMYHLINAFPEPYILRIYIFSHPIELVDNVDGIGSPPWRLQFPSAFFSRERGVYLIRHTQGSGHQVREFILQPK